MNEELTVLEVNGEFLKEDDSDKNTRDNPSMCYNPTNVAQCGSVHSIWMGCGANRYQCYIDCINLTALLSTLD